MYDPERKRDIETLIIQICDLFKKSDSQHAASHLTHTLKNEWRKPTDTLAARAPSVDLMKDCSVSGGEGGHSGLDWAYSHPWLPWGRKYLGGEQTYWATLSPFQAWKAHLMGREGCKQNSRRTVVSQRTQPAQGKAFIHPLLTPTSPTLTVRAIKSVHACWSNFILQLFLHYPACCTGTSRVVLFQMLCILLRDISHYFNTLKLKWPLTLFKPLTLEDLRWIYWSHNP